MRQKNWTKNGHSWITEKKYYYIAVRKIAVHAPQDGNHNCVI